MVVAPETTTASTGPGARGDRAGRWAPAVLPGVTMMLLGVAGVTRVGIGWDEAATADMATRSPAQIWATAQNIDAVFGPYYTVMHLWTSVFGLSELSLRAPSIIAMAVAVGLTGELGRRQFDPVVGTLAGLFLCVMPAISRYAQEARPYAICCMATALATLLLYRLTSARRGWRAWAAYGVAVVLIGASHLVALSVLGAHAIVVLLGRRRALLPWLAVVLAALLCLVPLVVLGGNQRDAQIGWTTTPTVQQIINAPGAIVGTAATGFLLLGLALPAAWRRPDLAALAAVPVVAVAAVSYLAEPIWVTPRYLLVALMPLALLAAAGSVRTARGGRTRLAYLSVVVLVLAGTAYHDQRLARGVAGHNGGNYKQAAEVIRRLHSPGDAIVFQSGRTMRAGMQYYLRDEPDRPADVLLARSAAARNVLAAEEHADPAAHLRPQRRVWLVVMGRPADPITRRPAAGPVLRSDFTRTQMWRFSRTTLALYTRR